MPSDSADQHDPALLAAEVEAVAVLKRAARQAARARRAAAHQADAGHAGPAVAAHLLDLLANWGRPVTVAGYWPKGDELDLVPTLAALADAGHGTCLPVVAGVAWPLIFRLWRPGHPLVPGAFRIMEPMAEAPLAQPDILLVPLLAFDEAGWRLGYGGGFYDRTLAALRDAAPVIAIGVGYAGQKMDSVPHDVYDQRLDWLVTEQGTRRF